MSGPFGRPTDHDRAHELAAWRMDGLLEPAEEAWLDEHLAECDACAAAAGDYATDRLLLQGLRDLAPEPPRDLWARTSSALEAEVARKAPGTSPARSPRPGRLGWVAAPVAGVAIVAVAVGAGLLDSQPVVSPGPLTALATPMAIAANIQVVGQAEDGHLEIRTQNVREVCPIGAETCSVAPSAATEPLAGMARTPIVTEAILSPNRDRLVIVQGDDDRQGVYVVPVAPIVDAGPTRSPAAAATHPATPEPVATASPALTAEAPSPDMTIGPATSASPGATLATGTPGASDAPGTAPTPTLDPAATPAPDASQSVEPGTTTSPATTEAPSGEPEPTPETGSAPPATPEPSPSVDVTPGPDGAIQIANDVIVVGPVAAYNGAGTRFAFTARPADGSAGPDVYVWDTSEPRARAVTSGGRSVFAGWHAGHLVVSRVDGRPGTYYLNSSDGTEDARVSDGWLPSINPAHTAAVWWDGDVRLADDGRTVTTGAGRLVLGPWEAEGAVQQLAAHPLRGWSAAWDPSGSVLAVWKAGPSDNKPGTLSLYRAAADGRTVDLENPIREDLPAFEGFVLDTDHLAWPATSDDGKPVVRVLAWNDDGVGVVELASEEGGTIVR